jgi:hypothetical protein
MMLSLCRVFFFKHDPMVATPLQESLHDVLTDNIGKNPKPHAEARTHANGKEIAMCVPVVATSELHCVLQDEQEHNGTAIPGSSNLYPVLTEEISQHKVRRCYSIRLFLLPIRFAQRSSCCINQLIYSD